MFIACLLYLDKSLEATLNTQWGGFHVLCNGLKWKQPVGNKLNCMKYHSQWVILPATERSHEDSKFRATHLHGTEIDLS